MRLARMGLIKLSANFFLIFRLCFFDFILSINLNTIEDIDHELADIIATINSSIHNCTSTPTFKCKASQPKPIPKHLISDIKLKHQIKRLKQKLNSPYINKLYNMLNNLKSATGQFYENDKILANEFGKNLDKIFNSNPQVETHIIVPSDSDQTNSLNEALISRQEFLIALNSINVKSAPGLDLVNNKALKNCPK
ncbi:hypothetical protein BpHYR1_000080, partial [Brachionus plicatilis]